jgi:hypothetical protein
VFSGSCGLELVLQLFDLGLSVCESAFILDGRLLRFTVRLIWPKRTI